VIGPSDLSLSRRINKLIDFPQGTVTQKLATPDPSSNLFSFSLCGLLNDHFLPYKWMRNLFLRSIMLSPRVSKLSENCWLAQVYCQPQTHEHSLVGMSFLCKHTFISMNLSLKLGLDRKFQSGARDDGRTRSLVSILPELINTWLSYA
jgi:hypothetical protein